MFPRGVHHVKFLEDCEIGDAFESHHTYRVTAEEIKRYASQWDPHPFHIDEEEAQKTPMGQLFAPSILTLAIATKLTHDTSYFEMATVAGLGINDVLMPKPVLAGDQLKVTITIVAKRESKSKPELGIVTSKIDVINQNDEIVLSYCLSGLVHRRPR